MLMMYLDDSGITNINYICGAMLNKVVRLMFRCCNTMKGISVCTILTIDLG